MLWLKGVVLCLLSASLSGSNSVSAANVYLRQAGEEESTTSAIATDAVETSTSSSTSGNAIETEAATSTATADLPSGTLPPKDDDVPECHANDTKAKPFCLPEDGQDVYVDNTYYVTWDSDLFPSNSTITVGLNYFNTTENQGKSAYTSEHTPNSYGYVPIKMEKSWLQSEARNNLTVFLIEYDPTSDERTSPRSGPMISLINEPPKHHPPPPHTPPPTTLGLAIGIPVGLAVIVLIAGGLCFGMRKHRRIGLGSIMGSRNKGYGGAQSRGQRLGGKRGQAITLDEIEDGSTSQYMDHPGPGIVSDAEAFNDVQRSKGNVFREEISRLKSWR